MENDPRVIIKELLQIKEILVWREEIMSNFAQEERSIIRHYRSLGFNQSEISDMTISHTAAQDLSSIVSALKLTRNISNAEAKTHFKEIMKQYYKIPINDLTLTVSNSLD
jgi:hypothetical protein